MKKILLTLVGSFLTFSLSYAEQAVKCPSISLIQAATISNALKNTNGTYTLITQNEFTNGCFWYIRIHDVPASNFEEAFANGEVVLSHIASVEGPFTLGTPIFAYICRYKDVTGILVTAQTNRH